ncbi:hypothetical protein HDF16_002230 [Granulicella aggregans]|uniref:Uncharacterized protein n=1 Tax=Granulicella aggregans TaxID=474949 RepID=A0A7W7ZDD5_9BACT|nr:hypothetical protein [Granulicella aggregans]MBB5057524.1 hypothetical protein [Granulicella aggregans]
MRTSIRAGSFVLALLLVGHTIGATAQSNGSVDDAMVRLSAVGFFAIGGTGFAGRISKGELDYKAILAQPQPQALKSFEQIYATGHPAAKGYALLGIHTLAPAKFDELYATVKDSVETVATMQGCILSTTKLSLIAKRINDGSYDRRIR